MSDKMENTITGKTKVAGIIGWPVAHSRSPVLHNLWFAQNHVDGAYVAFPVAPENVAVAVDGLKRAGVLGLNVTVPHKEKAFALADATSARAKRAGASNLLIFKEDGSIFADNTDGAGLFMDLDQRAKGWRDQTGPIVFFGAGGAARGVLACLLDMFDEGLTPRPIHIVVRSPEKASQMVAEMGASDIKVFQWDDMAAALIGASLIIQTTSLGMGGNDNFAPDFSRVATGAVAYDCVYTPKDTAFLIAAQQAGLTIVDGLGMLVGQAQVTFKLLFGSLPDGPSGMAALQHS